MRYYVFVKNSLNILVRNAWTMCFRCLIFSLSGPCEFLILFYCLLDLRSGECDVVSLYVLCCSVNGSVCFVCCVFVNCLGVFVILLLNVMELCVVGGALLDIPCMVFHRMCVLCLWSQ